jgi:hypothetical protein
MLYGQHGSWAANSSKLYKQQQSRVIAALNQGPMDPVARHDMSVRAGRQKSFLQKYNEVKHKLNPRIWEEEDSWTPSGKFPADQPIQKYIFRDDGTQHTLYSDYPREHVFMNSLRIEEASKRLLSMPMNLNGVKISATVDTASGISIVDASLLQDARYNIRMTDKKLCLDTVSGSTEVPVAQMTMYTAKGAKVDIRCAVAELSRSCHDKLLIGYVDLYRLGYRVVIKDFEQVEMEKTFEVHSDEILDPSEGFDDGLEIPENKDWDKHPVWKLRPGLLDKAYRLHDVAPSSHISFPGSEMPINTSNIVPSEYSNLRVLPGEIGKKIAQEIHKWHERGWVEPVQLSHDRIIYIPLLAVVKKNGDLRICLDFRRFNQCVRPLECAIPKISDFQETCSGMNYFTEIDLSDAFMQLRLREDNYYKLGIRTVDGYYTLNRAPFGLHTVPAHFQATIERMIAPIHGAKSYFDNVVAASKTLDEQAEILEKIIDTFLQYGVRVNMAKLQLCKSEMKMLGMIVSGKGIKADPEKISKCLLMKKPETVKQMRSLIGAVNFQRIFYPHASALMADLADTTKNNAKVVKWTEKAERAHKRLKLALSREIALFFPRPEDELVMYVDASDNAIAGALGVRDGDKFRPWRFHSKNISHVSHWSPTKKEFYALVSSLVEFYEYIFGRHITVYTDHQPLVSELKVRQPNKQVARWLEEISGLTFKVVYIPGETNVLADYLSRVEWETDQESVKEATAMATKISDESLTSWEEWRYCGFLVIDALRKKWAEASAYVSAV